MERFSDRALNALIEYDWHGNVRELRNTVERAILFCHQTILDIQNLTPEFQAAYPNIPYNRMIEQTGGSRLAEVKSGQKKIGHDEKTIREILTSTRWNVSEAARRLNISRTHLHRLIKKHNIVRGA